MPYPAAIHRRGAGRGWHCRRLVSTAVVALVALVMVVVIASWVLQALEFLALMWMVVAAWH